MPITVNIAGQVGQIRLAQSKVLWPLFETVINSIQSLEDTDTPVSCLQGCEGFSHRKEDEKAAQR